MKKILQILTLLLLAIAAQATTLTGSLKTPDGNNFNGRLVLELSQTVSVLSSGSCGGPYLAIGGKPIQFSIINGAMPGGASVVGNDCVAPTNTCYVVDEYDSNNNHLSQFRWSITGTTVDVGTLVPQSSTCPIAPTGNTITGPITILGDVTVTGNFSAAGQAFNSATLQSLTVTNAIQGVLSAIGVPAGNYLESNGSTYQPSNGAASGVGNCATGTPNSFVAALNSDAPPTCQQVQFTDVGGALGKAQLPGTTVYTDQANNFAVGNTQTFQDGINTKIANASDATKILDWDLSALNSLTTITQKIPNVTAGSYVMMYKEVSPQTVTAFFPGNLSSAWTGLSWTPGQSITITRVEIATKTSAFSCTVAPKITLQSAGGGGTTNISVTSSVSSSGTVAIGYTGGFAVTIGVTAGTCTTFPADANVIVSYIFQ